MVTKQGKQKSSQLISEVFIGVLRPEDGQGPVPELATGHQILDYRERLIHGVAHRYVSDKLPSAAQVETKALNIEVRIHEEGSIDLIEIVVIGVVPEDRHHFWSVGKGGNLVRQPHGRRRLVNRVEGSSEKPGLLAGDDHEILWIDVDRNGEFEASAGEDISRNVPPEDWNTAHTETVYLEAGKHYAIAIAMHEQAGGDFLDITIKKPGGTAEDVNPGAASQDGWWYRDLLSIDPSVANDAATVSYPNYTMNATLRATQAVFDAYIYWGTSDGGAAEGAWANTNFIGSYSNDNSINLGFTTNGLPQSTTYYYTFRVENSLTNIWATPTTNFTTLGPEYFLPFVETFEDRTLGNLDGQYGWSATGTEVQGGVTHAGSKAACIGTNSTDEMSHTFVDGQTDVWTDFYTRPKFGDPASAPTPPQYSTMAFFVSTNGQVIAFNGSTPTQLNHTALVDGSWVRFTTHSDYMDQEWDLYLDGDIIGTGMDFYTNATSYTRFGIVNPGTNSAYVDDINILLKPPPFIQGTVILVR